MFDKGTQDALLGEPQLAAMSAICLALPEAERVVAGMHAHFRIRGRGFAYFLNDHYGDGIVSVCCKLAADQSAHDLLAEPDRFYLPTYLGQRGWFGLRLDGGSVDWAEVEALVESSYRIVAPRTLVRLVDARRV